MNSFTEKDTLTPSTHSTTSSTHSLVFSSNFHSSFNDYHFLEIPDELIQEFESNLSTSTTHSCSYTNTNANSTPYLIFRGDKHDPLTLHTNNATYKVRQVQTSNTFFLCEKQQPLTNSSLHDFKTNEELNSNKKLDASWIIQHTTGNFLELIKSSPCIEKLHEYLKQAPAFAGHFDDILPEKSTFTFHQLLHHIQASEEELKNELEHLHAVEIQGILRILDPHFLKDVLTLIVSIIVTQDWSLNSVSFNAVSLALKEFDITQPISNHILKAFSESTWFTNDHDLHAHLSNFKITNFFAKVLLSKYKLGERIPYEPFLIKWKESVPEPLTCDPTSLSDCGIIESDPYTLTETLLYLNKDHLPLILSDRLRFLFQLKDRWLKDVLIFWIQDLVADQCPKRAEQWLLRNTKMVKQNNQVWFLPRKDLLSLR